MSSYQKLLLERLLRLQPAGKEMFLEYREFDMDIIFQTFTAQFPFWGPPGGQNLLLSEKTSNLHRCSGYLSCFIMFYHVLFHEFLLTPSHSDLPTSKRSKPSPDHRNDLTTSAFCNGPPGKSPPIASGGEVSEQRWL